MKGHVYLILALFLPLLGMGQESQEEQLQQKIKELEFVIKEQQQKIKELEFIIKEQQQKIDYLKEALDLRSKGLELTAEDVHMRINKVIGKRSDNSIYIEGIATYKGTTKRNLQFSTTELVAPNGAQYQSHSSKTVNDPNKNFFVQGAESGIPYGFSIQVKKVNEQVPSLSLVRLALYGGGVKGVVFNFKGVDVVWED